MKASETTLRQLLEGTKQFQIPLFQRPYSWKRDKWDDLWDDLTELYNGEEKYSYFLGSIVTQSIPGTAEGISPYTVIDGQQRLTTLSLILAGLRDSVERENHRLADEIHECYLINKYKDNNDDFYKVLPTQQDREIYSKIIRKDDNLTPEKQSKLLQSYKFFKKKLANSDIDYKKFKDVILERLVLVNITSDDQDNPYLIFESLNYKGQDLTQADLVRNYIFMKIPCESREEIYHQAWLPMEQSFLKIQPEKYAEELTQAFWFYLRKDGMSVSKKNVYKEIKIKFDSANNINDQLGELVKFVNYYQKMNFETQEANKELWNYFNRLIRLDFATCHIFLLNIYDEYERNIISLDDFKKTIEYLESYFVRRLFSGISTASLGKLFDNLYNDVKKERQFSQDETMKLSNSLRKVLLSYDGKKIWPDDERFKQGIIHHNIYTTKTKGRVKLIFEILEKSMTKEIVAPEKLTVEHIMPQTLRDEWKEELGENYVEIHKKWLHTLGNLTLTAYNGEQSNKPFTEKYEFLKNSNLSINHYFREYPSQLWGEKDIQNRAEEFAKIAIEIWHR